MSINGNGNRPFVHCVTYGTPGSGKSTFLATFPKPLLVLSTDPLGKEGPYLRRGVLDPTEYATEQGLPLTRVMSAKDESRLIVQIENYHDDNPREPHTFRKLQSRWREVREEVAAGVWATVVIDGITFLELAARKHYQYIETKGKEPRRWYAQSTDDLEELVLCGAGSLRCNVGIAAHVDADYDEVMGHRIHNPSAPGRMRSRFGAGFPEMYVAHALLARPGEEPRYWLQTRTDHQYGASSVLLQAPNPCDPTFQALWSNFSLPVMKSGAATAAPQPAAAAAAPEEASNGEIR